MYYETIVSFIFFLFILFISLLNYIEDRYTDYLSLEKYVKLPINQRWKFNQAICLFCREKQLIFYYNPIFDYIEFKCENCKDSITH